MNQQSYDGEGQQSYEGEGLQSAHDQPARKSQVDADVFFALDLRVGRVTRVEEFPQARKPALKLTVDFGPAVGELHSSAQLTNYRREELLDRLVIGAINLGTKRIAGFASEFLVLGALERDGVVRLLAVDDSPAPGTPVG